MQRKQIQRVHEIVPQSWIDRLRVQFALPLRLIDADQFLSFARVLAKAIVGNPIKPGRKFRLAAEAMDVLVSAQKSFLGQIVGQCEIRPGKLAQQTSHTRLMTTNQLAKRVLVVINKNSSDKVRIS